MSTVHLHCYTHMGFHAHGNLAIRRPDRDSAEREAAHQSLANGLAVFLFEEGSWPRVFVKGVEQEMRRVE